MDESIIPIGLLIFKSREVEDLSQMTERVFENLPHDSLENDPFPLGWP